jgi:methylated-DNA-protein-cysteine methyltransferase-like protein
VSGRVVGPGFFARVYEVVRRIPPGRVATYADIAEHLGARSVARKVGHALAALPADRDDVPWFRVVNVKGEVARRAHGAPSTEQILLLGAEGTPVDHRGRVENFETRRFSFF